MDIDLIKNIIDTGDPEKIAVCIKKYNLILKDNKILFPSEIIKGEIEFYDKRQLVRKILLNSALIPSACTQ